MLPTKPAKGYGKDGLSLDAFQRDLSRKVPLVRGAEPYDGTQKTKGDLKAMERWADPDLNTNEGWKWPAGWSPSPPPSVLAAPPSSAAGHKASGPGSA